MGDARGCDESRVSGEERKPSTVGCTCERNGGERMTNNNINDEGAAIAGWLASKAGIRVMPEQYSVVHGRLSNVVKQRGIRMNEFIALL